MESKEKIELLTFISDEQDKIRSYLKTGEARTNEAVKMLLSMVNSIIKKVTDF